MLHTIHSTLQLPPINSSYALYRYTYSIQHMLLPAPSHHFPQFPRHRKNNIVPMHVTYWHAFRFFRTGLQFLTTSKAQENTQGWKDVTFETDDCILTATDLTHPNFLSEFQVHPHLPLLSFKVSDIHLSVPSFIYSSSTVHFSICASGESKRAVGDACLSVC